MDTQSINTLIKQHRDQMLESELRCAQHKNRSRYINAMVAIAAGQVAYNTRVLMYSALK